MEGRKKISSKYEIEMGGGVPVYEARSQNCEKRLLNFITSTWNDSAPTGRILIMMIFFYQFDAQIL